MSIWTSHYNRGIELSPTNAAIDDDEEDDASDADNDDKKIGIS